MAQQPSTVLLALLFSLAAIHPAAIYPAAADDSVREDRAPKLTPDVVYGHKDGLAMTMDVYRPDGAPALVIMGGKDDLVPPKHGEWIDKAFDREKVAHKLIVFPDAGHGLEGKETQATLVREATGWFERHLGR